MNADHQGDKALCERIRQIFVEVLAETEYTENHVIHSQSCTMYFY